MCNRHLLLCPVPTNLLSTFGTGSSTKSTVPRNIFIFNCTLDAKPLKLFRCACGSAKAFIKFQLKSYEDVLQISKSFFKYHTVFLLTLGVSNIDDAIGLPYNPTVRLWSGGIVVIQLVLLYPFNLLWSRKTSLFGAFLYRHQLFYHAMVWSLIIQQHFSLFLTLFWRCKMSSLGKCSSSHFQNEKLH